MSNKNPLEGESLKIILIILLGWTAFSFADAITKYLAQSYNPAMIITIGSGMSGACLVAWILLKKGWRGFLSPNWKWLIVRAACIAGTATGIVNALAHIELTDLYGITFTAPFLALIMAYFLLKEQVGWHRWLAVIAGFIGVFILLGPQFEEFNIGIIFALLAMISIACGTIVIRKIGSKEYLPLFILYPTFGMFIVNLPMAIPNFTPPPTDEWWQFGFHSLTVFLGQLLTTYAISNAKATASVAPFVYIQVILGAFLGWVIFGDLPSITTAIGLIIIVSAGLYMLYRERQLNR